MRRTSTISDSIASIVGQTRASALVGALARTCAAPGVLDATHRKACVEVRAECTQRPERSRERTWYARTAAPEADTALEEMAYALATALALGERDDATEGIDRAWTAQLSLGPEGEVAWRTHRSQQGEVSLGEHEGTRPWDGPPACWSPARGLLSPHAACERKTVEAEVRGHAEDVLGCEAIEDMTTSELGERTSFVATDGAVGPNARIVHLEHRWWIEAGPRGKLRLEGGTAQAVSRARIETPHEVVEVEAVGTEIRIRAGGEALWSADTREDSNGTRTWFNALEHIRGHLGSKALDATSDAVMELCTASKRPL